MRGGRSMQRLHGHRIPVQGNSETPEDWGEESWTVDCICGVNFDDGEEMVNCDDCGVWVHTRCSRYVKGEDLFTCDKCKKRQNLTTRRSHTPNSTNDSSEETEVAQLLVELPTKTIKFDSCQAPMVGRRPFRLWTDIPMEDRVHVQGIPGGDPALFAGLGSAIFSPALWKTTGYVPKKFSFQYREFPCWDKDSGVDAQDGENGAGVLFSLSRGNGISGRCASELRGASNWSPEARGLKFGAKKERSLLRSVVLQSSKRKKDDPSSIKDRDVRKKIKTGNRETQHEKKSVSNSRDDIGPRSSKGDDQTRSANDLGDTGMSKVGLNMHIPSEIKLEIVKNDSELVGSPLNGTSVELQRPVLVKEEKQKGIKTVIDDYTEETGERITNNGPALFPEHRTSLSSHVKIEIEHKLCASIDSQPENFVDVKGPVKNLDCSSSDAHVFDSCNARTDDILSPSPRNENSTSIQSEYRRKAFPFDNLLSTDPSTAVKGCCDGFPKRQPNKFTPSESEFKPILKENPKSGSSFSYQGAIVQEEGSSPRSIKSPGHEDLRCDEHQSCDCSHHVSESSAKKNSCRSSSVKDPDKSSKEHYNSTSSASKIPHSTKVANSPPCWRTVSVSKDSSLLTSKALLPQHSSEAYGQEKESAADIYNKVTVKEEKSNFTKNQLSNSTNCQLLPTNSGSNATSTALSDEELALLLHQELNSSPRVPRVPRAWSGVLPQLNSPTTASMILKRSSFSWGKDHRSFARRKTKNASKDGHRHLHEPDDECTKLARRIPSSPDYRGHEMRNLSSRKEGESLNGSTSIKSKNSESTSIKSKNSGSTVNSGPSSSFEVNDNNWCSSSQMDASDEDTGSASGSVHRTLPVLIHEIMSKGRRMTYEELCNAVLPHWNNLRKHNGERYAYSGPSQAVLDCLRNRQEWAQLVDRGPKTNLSRKRRKTDAEESDENEEMKGDTPKDEEGKSLESQRNEFPRGKRNARKRKFSGGRISKDSEKRQKAGSVSEDDSASFSDGTEKSQSSQDEIEDNEAETEGTDSSTDEDESEA